MDTRNRSFALAYAKDLIAAWIRRDADIGTDELAELTLQVADKFNAWLEQKRAPQQHNNDII